MSERLDQDYESLNNSFNQLDRLPSYTQQRLEDIQDNISKDQKLLKRYEDALRTEGHPREEENYRKEIQTLQKRIQDSKVEEQRLRQQIELLSRVPCKLTQFTGRFIGRENLISSLANLLKKHPGWCGVAGLYGPPGSGKSTLACHFAQEYQQELFPDGVIAIDLRLYVDYKGKEKLNEIAKAFITEYLSIEIASNDRHTAVRIMKDTFRERRMLLIFDNAENVEIKDLFPDKKRCAILVTARERELLASVVPLKSILPRVEEFSQEEAIQFLQKLLEESFADDKPLGRIAETLHYLPLALEIAGRQLYIRFIRHRDNNSILLSEEDKISIIYEYADLLVEEQTRLIEKLQICVSGAIHLDIRSSFSLSLKFLSKEELSFLISLSACQHEEFALFEAQVLFNCDRSASESYLEYLEQISLIKSSSRRRAYYVFHPLIRSFIQDVARHPNYYGIEIDCKLLESAKVRYREFLEQFKRNRYLSNHTSKSNLEENFQSFLEAAEWFLKYSIPEYKLIEALLPFFERKGSWKQAVNLLDGFQKLAQSIQDNEAVVHFSIQKAKYLGLEGKNKDAQNVLELADQLSEKIKDLDSRGRLKSKILHSLGLSLDRQGKSSEAEQSYILSIRLKEQLNDLLGLGITYNSLGMLQAKQKRWSDAISNIDRSINIGKSLNNSAHLVKALTSLGAIYYQTQKYFESETIFNQALATERERRSRKGEGMVLNSLTEVQIKLSKLQEARQNCQLSLEIKEEVGDLKGKAIQLHTLSRILLEQNQFELAFQHLRDSIYILEEQKDERSAAMVRTTLGRALLTRGQFENAIEQLVRGFEIEERNRNQKGIELVLPALIEALVKTRQSSKALNYCQRGIAINASNGRFLGLCS